MEVNKQNAKATKNKKPIFMLPDWVHKIKIRYYKEIYPKIDDTVIARIKHIDFGIGYYMEMVEYADKEALIVLKEVSRNYRVNVVKHTLLPDNNYPLTVMDRTIKRIVTSYGDSTLNEDGTLNEDNVLNEDNQTIKPPTHTHNNLLSTNHQELDIQDIIKENEDDSNDSNDSDDYEEVDSDDDIDFTDDSINVRIDLSNRQLTEPEKKEANNFYTAYKHIHTMFHDYAFQLRQSTLTSQEEGDNIEVMEYHQFLENLALKTIWKYSKTDIVDIIHKIRDDIKLLDNYFELNDLEKNIFIRVLNRKILKTKYTITCIIHLQTIDIEGVKIIHEALGLLNTNDFNVKVISSPEYMIQLEMSLLSQLEDKFRQNIIEINKYMTAHLGFVQIKKCDITNNKNDNVVPFNL
jgi:translation initiation factor 2 alpha subunit (eIF-2alpha)